MILKKADIIYQGTKAARTTWYVGEVYRFSEDQNYPCWLVTVKGREVSQKEGISSKSGISASALNSTGSDMGNT